MNIFKAKFDPYMQTNSFLMNDSPVSGYSRLNNYITMPLISFADQFAELIRDEINGYYELEIIGDSFEKLFLEDIFKTVELCTGYSTVEFEWPSSIEKRFNAAKQLAVNYHISADSAEYRIPMFTNLDQIENESFFVKSSSERSELAVCDETILNSDISYCISAKIIIVVNETDNRVEFTNSGQYLWYTSQEKANEKVQAVIDRFAKIPFIIDTAGKIASLSNVTENDRTILELLLATECPVEVEEIERIEVGKEVSLKFRSMISNGIKPKIRLESSNESILSVDGTIIRAVEEGEASIFVYRKYEGIPFKTIRVKAYVDRSIRQIILDRGQPNMGIGQTQKINISFLPIDSKDTGNVIWRSDATNIAIVNDEGLVKAVGSGRVHITASVPSVKESVTIDVLPNISKIIPDETKIKVAKDDYHKLLVTKYPQNCYNENVHWESSDTSIATIEERNDGNVYVKGNEIGECKLICSAEEGACWIDISVKVIDKAIFLQQQTQQMLYSSRHSNARYKEIDTLCMILIPCIIVLVLILLSIFANI